MTNKKNVRSLSIALSLFFVIILTACNNLGYPSVIKFPPEGGSQMVTSKTELTEIGLADGDNYVYAGLNKSIELNWLKITIYSANKYEVTAQTNTSGERRTMDISIQELDIFCNITVIQD